MNSVILSRCGLFCIHTFKIVSLFHKPKPLFSIMNNVPSNAQNRAQSVQMNRSNEFILYPVTSSTDVIMQRNQHLSIGRVMLKPMSETDVKKSIESLTDKFLEARELLTDARESEGTVYFSEDMEEAQEAVKDTVNEYSELLLKLSEEQQQNVVRTIGLKMEELKAQLQAMMEKIKEDH